MPGKIIEFKIYCKECKCHIKEDMIYKKINGGYICEFCFDGEITCIS